MSYCYDPTCEHQPCAGLENDAVESQVARYTISITLDRPIRQDELDPAFSLAEHLASYVSTDVAREIEREILRALRKLDGDVDCEVISSEIVREDAHV